MDFKARIRVIPDFPQKGVSFKDITTLLKDGPLFRQTIDALAAPFRDKGIDTVVGPEARGFVIGAPVAYALGAGFVPVRKPGKLPGPVLRHAYTLEYGQDVLEIHRDAIQPGQRILVVDDLLATGGTSRGVVRMVEQLGGVICGLLYLIELSYLGGRDKLVDYEVYSLVKY